MSRRLGWSRMPGSVWTDELALELDALGLLVRVTALRYALADGGHTIGGEPAPDSIGWLITEDGCALTSQVVATLCRARTTPVRARLALLVSRRFLVMDDAGCYGVQNWLQTQETPAAARMRRHRERNSDATVTPAVTTSDRAVTTEERKRKRRGEEEEKRREPEPAAARGTLPGLDPDAAVVSALRAHHEARQALGLTSAGQPLRVTPRKLAMVRSAGVADFEVASRRMAEAIRRQSERDGCAPRSTGSAPYFNAEHLCRERTREIYLAEDHLDRREPQAAKIQPRGRAAPPVNEEWGDHTLAQEDQT